MIHTTAHDNILKLSDVARDYSQIAAEANHFPHRKVVAMSR
uniref:Uncharacterized protein n=1 Tax=Arundo donax TaxID=35708 RepID=A0A0A8Z820_ARUDO